MSKKKGAVAATDPVVIGLGRLLLVVGALVVLALMSAVCWLL